MSDLIVPGRVEVPVGCSRCRELETNNMALRQALTAADKLIHELRAQIASREERRAATRRGRLGGRGLTKARRPR
jgi:hypothetical protein